MNVTCTVQGHRGDVEAPDERLQLLEEELMEKDAKVCSV